MATQGTHFQTGAQVAGRFTLMEPLGQGGLAEVWSALDAQTGQVVALKALHAHLCSDEKLVDRFRRELSITRGLDHAHIVRVFELHEDGGRPLLTMELLQGRTLATRMTEGRVPRQEAVRVAQAVLQALETAHRAGVVHRDVKPQNIFLTNDGGVKLLDFGLARVAGWVRLTAQSTVLGTPGYLAPETLEGKSADARADLYAMGAVLHELLSGKPAFESADPLAVLRKKREAPPSPKAVDPAVSAADDALVRRLLEPDPERRFLEATQVLRALSGEETAPALAPPPALTAGELDVVIHGGGLLMSRDHDRALDDLHAPARGTGWRRRLSLMGEAILVSGTSRASAEEMALVCEERGIACAIEPSKPRRPWREWLSKRANRIAGLAAAVSGSAMFAFALASFRNWTTGAPMDWATTWENLGFPAVMLSGVAAFLSGLLVWGLLGMGEAPPFRSLPEGDRGVRRLVDGIARRITRLKARAENASSLHQPLLAELVETAERMQESVTGLADVAAVLPDDMSAASPVDQTIPHGTSRARDAAVTRLLEVAAALDEAWLVLDHPGGDLSVHSKLLSRLREETELARSGLPTRDLARGIPPARIS
ncbi:MAG: serine/threonine protein kinase [Deltaproteobacteria bacterium]|nr:serine/threonine protein kinase [Deltaproteobacteria bacterium]